MIASGAIAAMGGAYLSLGFVHSFNENMTSGTGFIGLAALVFGKWRPFPTWARRCCSASRARSPTGCRTRTATSGARCSRRLPYLLTMIAVAGVIGRSIGPAAAGRPYDKQ